MTKDILVRKASGDMEQFSVNKIKGSLMRSGANPTIVEDILEEIVQWVAERNRESDKVLTTKIIYKKAFALLRKLTSGSAARYKLKSAMMELGPTGHPFEHFMGEIYRVLGYDTIEVAQTLQGHALTHEVDVVATRKSPKGDTHQHIVECKYYQSNGKNAGVQVSLYVHSRMEDIFSLRKEQKEYSSYTFTGGVATNTRFSSDAIAYGEYAGLKLLSWDYPKGESLREIVDRERIFPVTALSSITRADKEYLMERGVVICRQLKDNPQIINELNLSNTKRKHLTDELISLLN
jgi:hypothetical protein